MVYYNSNSSNVFHDFEPGREAFDPERPDGLNRSHRSVLRNLVMPIQTANYQRSPTTVSNVTSSRIPIIHYYYSLKHLLNFSSKNVNVN